jgi:predicted permease
LPTGYSGAGSIVVADVEAPRSYSAAQVKIRIDALRHQASTLPGVLAAGATHIRPLSGFSINGYLADVDAYAQDVTPGFLAAMGTRLLAGRDFTDHDDAATPQVAIVNEAFLRQYLPGQPPLGKHFGIEIVGVVQDTRWLNLRDQPPAMYYRPCAQWVGAAHTLVVRTSGNFAAAAAALARAARDIDPRLALKDVIPFSEMEDRKLVTERMVAQGAAAFGGLALLVACVGLYGMLAYGVARRTREIGVRIALGASQMGVQWMVVRESLVLLALGFVIGVPAALGLTRYAGSMLFGITPHDPMPVVIAFGILVLVALAASWIPARRAASVDPLTALRYE